MREFKFRAWDPEQKRMFKPFDLLELQSDDGGWEFGEEGLGSYTNPYKCIFMQYTGLKDKNGTKIYEGDVLHEFREKTAPMASNGVDRIVVCNDIRYMQFDQRNCTIIGNIYEHPHLLSNQ